MLITFQQLIDMFVDGTTEGYSGTKTNKGDLKIIGITTHLLQNALGTK